MCRLPRERLAKLQGDGCRRTGPTKRDHKRRWPDLRYHLHRRAPISCKETLDLHLTRLNCPFVHSLALSHIHTNAAPLHGTPQCVAVEVNGEGKLLGVVRSYTHYPSAAAPARRCPSGGRRGRKKWTTWRGRQPLRSLLALSLRSALPFPGQLSVCKALRACAQVRRGLRGSRPINLFLRGLKIKAPWPSPHHVIIGLRTNT